MITKLFSQRSHYRASDRGMLADILRPYWKDSPISAEERIGAYGVQTERFQLVDEPASADFCVLPMYWNFYYTQQRICDALDFVQLADSHRKPVISWVGGDFGVRVPSDAVYVFRASGYHSRRGTRQFASPVFIRDLAKEMPHSGLVFHSKPERPRIGFCGQAGDSFWKRTAKVLMTAARNSSFFLGFSPHEPQSLYPPTLLRARVLQILEQCPHVDTVFVKREKYHAGAEADDVISRQATRREFLDNIRETDYAVCVRGTGNFSQRFYEVMAMGRIPVFVNTDCMLPFDHIIDWRQYCVWVDAREIRSLPQRVLEFHHSLSPEAFRERQMACRRLWESHLSYPGFFTHFLDHFLPANDGSNEMSRPLPSETLNDTVTRE